VYAHWGIGDMTEAGLTAARERLERLRVSGYTAFKSGPGGAWRGHEPPAVIDAFVRRAYLMREWVGPEVELAFDLHGKMTPALAIELCHELKGMRPMFVEEPVPQENVAALRQVAERSPVPIATGERLLTRWGFREVLEKQAAAIVQPDICHAGGIGEVRKIAAMAETYYAAVAPHNPLGPISLAASLQVDACTPNFLCQEQITLGEGYLKQPFVQTNGYIDLPTAPGLGIELDEEALSTTMADDGSWQIPHLFHEDDNSFGEW